MSGIDVRLVTLTLTRTEAAVILDALRTLTEASDRGERDFLGSQAVSAERAAVTRIWDKIDRRIR